MELNDLKPAWQNVAANPKSDSDILRMTKIVNHPSLKKIRRKLIIEVIGLTLFLFIYYDGFDGDKKPLYVNALLVSSVILFILNHVISYFSIAGPIGRTNLKVSIRNYLVRIKRLSVLSLIISFIYGISLIIFFSSVIKFTPEKSWILSGIILILLLMTYISYRIWNNRIKRLHQQAKEFDDE